jgi:hypothetical protein
MTNIDGSNAANPNRIDSKISMLRFSAPSLPRTDGREDGRDDWNTVEGRFAYCGGVCYEGLDLSIFEF